MEIVTLFPQTVIHPVLDSNTITLQEDPRTIVYCAVPKQAANQQPDELTRIIQNASIQICKYKMYTKTNFRTV